MPDSRPQKLATATLAATLPTFFLVSLLACSSTRTASKPLVDEPPVGTVMHQGPLLDSILEDLRRRHPAVLEDPAGHRFQMLLSVPVKRGGEVLLERYGYRVDAEYFYPASSIKTCAAIAALELLEALRQRGETVDESTPLIFHLLFADDTLAVDDASNLEGGTITVGHELRKLFLVSDNQAFNRLLELAGRRAVNRSMWRVGLKSVRIHHRLSEARTREENRRSPRVELVVEGRGSGRRLEIEHPPDDPLEANDQPGLRLGIAHWRGGERLAEPFDFAYKNRISLLDLQDLNVLLLQPDLLPGRPRFALGEGQIEQIHSAMSQLPRESPNPRYPEAEVPDEWVKFYLPGLRRWLPAGSSTSRLRVYDKSGRAYGFTLDNAWIVDRESGRSFFLTAVLYTNPNQTLNDDDYAYEELADPFFADLGEAAARAVWGDGGSVE